MTKNKVLFFLKGSIEIVDGEGKHEFPYHTHDSLLIGVVKSGEARFAIGSNEYLLGKGMTYLVPPNVGISINPIIPYSYLTICIKNHKTTRFGQYKLDLYVLNNMGECLIGLCERYKLKLLSDEEFINNLIKTLELQDNEVNQNKVCTSAAIMDAIIYIKEHVNDKFLLDELTKAVHLSKYHLVRVFKNEMGITPKQYDQQCKIRRVKEWALQEKAGVDIATNLNYSNQGHLCSMFKRYMGISMNEYKSSVHKEEQ